jgi:hypothetical protein
VSIFLPTLYKKNLANKVTPANKSKRVLAEEVRALRGSMKREVAS